LAKGRGGKDREEKKPKSRQKSGSGCFKFSPPAAEGDPKIAAKEIKK
jgi:hypothetical protein